MTPRRSWLGILLVLGLLAGCTGEEDDRGSEARQGSAGAVTVTADGLVVDPGRLEIGDRVGDFVVDSLAAGPAAGVDEGGWVGRLALAGEAELSGRYGEHPAHPERGAICFFPEGDDARRLPRFPDDDRRVWFCFDDLRAASAAFGPPPVAGNATVVIDRLHYVRAHADADTTARLVRVVERQRELPGGELECSAALTDRELAPQPRLPAAVDLTRRAIFAAALDCDWDRLGELAGSDLSYSFGDEHDAKGYWRGAELAGEPVLQAMADVLQLTPAERDGLWTWPGFFLSPVAEWSDEQRQEATSLLGIERRDEVEAQGEYLGYRLGIAADGTWRYFIAGD